jgi:hypothetical protein
LREKLKMVMWFVMKLVRYSYSTIPFCFM